MSLKKIVLSLSLIFLPSISFAADIVNGWSGHTTISQIYSEWTKTYFALEGTGGNSCGHPSYWMLPSDQSYLEASQIKHSLLLAAFAAKKTINVRCENSRVSDFQIFD